MGGQLFDHALYMCELATRTSTIAGVLWHQGESDCTDELYPSYGEKLAEIMHAFREKLCLYDVPFLLVGLGDFLSNNNYFGNDRYKYINQALKQYAENTAMTGFVSAEGLTSNPDFLHFNSKSLREFGLRCYKKFLELEDKNKIYMERKSVISDTFK